MSTPNLNSAARAARDLPPETSFTALSEPNAAAPKLTIHTYDSAIASHSLFARSGRHTRLRSHSQPPLFKSLNISSIHMRMPYSLPSVSGQFVTRNHGSAWLQSHTHSAQSALSSPTS